MKKFLLSLFFIGGTLFSFERLNAQCDLEFHNLRIEILPDPVPVGTNKCEYTFNASFDIVTNSGFKHLYFHSWLLQDYPSPPIFDCRNGHTPARDPGTSAELGMAVDEPGKSFIDFGFEGLFDITFAPDDPVNVTANISTNYTHDPSVVLTMPSNSPGLSAVITRKGSSDTLHFDVSNIRIVINTPCDQPVVVVTDIWGSNSNAPDPKAQCYICGIGRSLGEPEINLTKTCIASPFQYTIALKSFSPVDLHVVYRIYADDLDGIKEPGGDDPLLFTSDTIIVNATTSFNSGLVPLPNPYCCVDPWAQWGIFADVTAREFSNIVGTPVVEEACAALPVTLRSFTAARNNSTVLLKWETVTEDDNKGFYVQRNLGNGTWEILGFVESKATRGNSNSSLTYIFTDLNNNAKGISQYRLQQVDIDGKSAYSPIRAVRATGQKGKTIIYPNPSADGKVNVVFADVNTIRDVSLMDFNGRILKQWKGITTNNIRIDNLSAGFYTVRIVDTESGEQTVEKIVVKKR